MKMIADAKEYDQSAIGILRNMEDDTLLLVGHTPIQIFPPSPVAYPRGDEGKQTPPLL